MFDLFSDPAFWAALFSVTLIQVALGADNLIIITILANKLPVQKQGLAIQVGLILAMVFRIILLGLVSWLADCRHRGLHDDRHGRFCPAYDFEAALSGKAVVLVARWASS